MSSSSIFPPMLISAPRTIQGPHTRFASSSAKGSRNQVNRYHNPRPDSTGTLQLPHVMVTGTLWKPLGSFGSLRNSTKYPDRVLPVHRPQSGSTQSENCSWSCRITLGSAGVTSSQSGAEMPCRCQSKSTVLVTTSSTPDSSGHVNARSFGFTDKAGAIGKCDIAIKPN